MPILAIHFSTRSLQSTGKQVFRDGTDRQTHTQHLDMATQRLNRPRGPIQQKSGLYFKSFMHKSHLKIFFRSPNELVTTVFVEQLLALYRISNYGVQRCLRSTSRGQNRPYLELPTFQVGGRGGDYICVLYSF